MSNPVDRPGVFRGTIVEYGLKEYDSGSVAVVIRAHLFDLWDEQAGEWQPWGDFDMEASGSVFIVKKDSTLNQLGVKSLTQHAGWDGSIESIQNQTWVATQCQFVIREEEYEGKRRMKIDFINDYFRTPGAGLGANMTPEKAKLLNAKFASQLRAIAGNGKTPLRPSGSPPAPPPRTPVVSNAPAHGEEIPF